jgi:hypothetical protein|tara:strand:+ start:9450 stop:9914 length:465 start_codon:yes stop_codon:yes gene_type:complete
MKIRRATQADDDAVIDVLRKFAEAQPISKLKVEATQYNDHHVRKVLNGIRTAGVLLLADVDGEVAGLFMAVNAPDLWVPNMRVMTELVWWVNPEHRDSSAGLRLLKEYTKIGETMVKAGKISTFTMTLLNNSPITNLEKRGWTPVETNYVFGAI